MIEIIYKDLPEENEKNENLKIPKNIRQIGTSKDNFKIYVEDYVMLFLKQIPAGEQEVSYGILLGTVCVQKGVTYIFVSALLQAPTVTAAPTFTQELWKQLLAEKGKYFNSLDVVGWYVDLPQSNHNVQMDLLKIQVEQFGKQNQICFQKERQEGESGFWRCENGTWQREEGYAIYYEKNENLEAYFMEHKVKLMQLDENGEAKQKGGMFRLALGENKGRALWSGRIAKAGGMVATIAFVVMAVTVLQQKGELDELSKTVSTLAGQNEQENESGKDVVVEEVKGEVTTTLEEQTTAQAQKETKNKDTEEEKTETEQVNASVSYYTVKEGETLFQICMKIYNDSDMLEKLREANNLDEDYSIYEGQKLILP